MKKYLFLLFIFIIPFNVFASDYIPNAKSGILIEANSGKIIFEKNIDERLSVASMTKMVAQIIILEEIEKGNISFDDVVTVSLNASKMGGSQIYLSSGEKITVRDLMKGISVASGNDATVAMAEYISGSEEEFVKKMNNKVKELGLKNTHFVNSTGLDEKNHYSSSYDMAVIARELVNNHPSILEFSSIYEDYLREDTNNKFWLVNTNKLIRFYDGADGLKTGHTDDAGYCLAATAKRGDLRLIAIVLGEDDSKTRNNEAMELLDYGFQTIHLNCLYSKGREVKKMSLDKADKDISIVLKDNLCVIEEKDKSYDYKFKGEMDKVTIPIKKGDKLGKLIVYDNNKEVSFVNLTVLESVSKMKLSTFIIKQFLNLIYGIF